MTSTQLRDLYLDQPHTAVAQGESGVNYQIETLVFWDAGDGRDLRVIVAVDDGGLRASAPLCEDFIIAPDGSFVGE